MRRFCVVALVVAMAGGYAEAGPEPLPSVTPVIHKIESFVAAQRLTDGRLCSEQGYVALTAGHDDCVRELAARRRAALRDIPAGTDI